MKKFIAMLMVLALAVCLFPMAAFADGYSNIAEILPVMERQSRSMSGYISGYSVNQDMLLPVTFTTINYFIGKGRNLPLLWHK